MNRKNLFELFVKHSNKIDLMKIKTDFIFDTDNEESFIKEAYELWDKEISNAGIGNIVTNYYIFVSKEGIVFFLNFSTWETHPEGPNNEPPGIQYDWGMQWCTKSSELLTTSDLLNKPYRFFENWEKIKKEAEESLATHKKVEYV